MSLNKVLASIGLILALLAAFVGTAKRGDRYLDEIASMIESEKDHITPLELAEQIHSGKNLRLIDLRDSVSHYHQHIFNSERMSVQQLLDDGIKRNEVVVLYSEGGVHASQAWILLKMKRYDSVYTLLGGFGGWMEEILNPKSSSGGTSAERRDFERRKMLSLFFGGMPSVISQDTSQIQSSRKQAQPAKVKKGEDKLRFHC